MMALVNYSHVFSHIQLFYIEKYVETFSQSVLSLICSINKVNELGAKVVKNKQEISEGYYAVLEDPQGNTFGVWQDK